MAGSTRLAKKLICALNCILLTMAEHAVESTIMPQNPTSPDAVLGLPRFNARSINTSKMGTTVTRSLYAVKNNWSGELCQILVAIMGTRMPRGRITVGERSCASKIDDRLRFVKYVLVSETNSAAINESHQ